MASLDLRRQIGRRIREERERLDLSPTELARRAGTEYRIVRRWEEGQSFPLLESLERVARALNVPLYEFFRFDRDSRDLDIEAIARLVEKRREKDPSLPRRLLGALRILLGE